MKYLVSPIGNVCKVGGLYYLKTIYKDIFICFTTVIYDNKDNLIGCLGVEEATHVYNKDFSYYFIPIFQTTEYCIEDALAYPWWSLEEEKIK